MRWEKLQAHSKYGGGVGGGGLDMGQPCSGPGKRWGHTCNAIKGGKLLYVFGGYGQDDRQTNQVHVFDTTRRTWSEPMMKGSLPLPRDSHTCTTVGDNLFVFGGTDGKNPLNDLHILDTSSNTWIQPYVRGEGPEAREGHSAALIGKRLFIFGGCGKSFNSSMEEYYDDLYILNTETLVWKRVQTSGTPPSKRDSHTCSSWKNKIIVIGGEDTCNYYLSDVHILDTDTLIWGKLNTSGQLLPPRAGHTTVELGKYLFVFGGFTDEQNLYDDIYMLDVDTRIWTKVMAICEGPSARFSMAGDCLDPQLGGILVFIGGCNRSLEALDDMFYLYTGLANETERDERRLEKLSLRKQLKLKCQEQHVVTPLYDRALIRVESNVDGHQSFPVPIQFHPNLLSTRIGRQNIYLKEYQTPNGKKTFQAKVTKSFIDSYTIETVIDGKSLLGVLFSIKPSFKKTADDDSTGKRGAAENDNAKTSGNQNSRSETAIPFKLDVLDDGHVDGSVDGKEPNLPESQVQEAAALNAQNPSSSNASPSREVLDDIKSSTVFNVSSQQEEQTSSTLHLSTVISEKDLPASANDSASSISNQADGGPLNVEEPNLFIKTPPTQTV